jgi:hypothetical protein
VSAHRVVVAQQVQRDSRLVWHSLMFDQPSAHHVDRHGSASSATQSPGIAGDVATGVSTPRRRGSAGATRQSPRMAFSDVRPAVGTPRRLAATGATRQSPRHVRDSVAVNNWSNGKDQSLAYCC